MRLGPAAVAREGARDGMSYPANARTKSHVLRKGRNPTAAPPAILGVAVPGHGQDRQQHEPGIPLPGRHGCGRNTQIAAGSEAVARTPR